MLQKWLSSSLFNLLDNISKDIMLGEGVKNLCKNYYKVRFFFKNENNNIKCKATVNNFAGDMQEERAAEAWNRRADNDQL